MKYAEFKQKCLYCCKMHECYSLLSAVSRMFEYERIYMKRQQINIYRYINATCALNVSVLYMYPTVVWECVCVCTFILCFGAWRKTPLMLFIRLHNRSLGSFLPLWFTFCASPCYQLPLNVSPNFSKLHTATVNVLIFCYGGFVFVSFFFPLGGGRGKSANESGGRGWGFVAENRESLACLAKSNMAFGCVAFWSVEDELSLPLLWWISHCVMVESGC